MTTEREPLPGTTDYQDSKDHVLYECYLCGRLDQIFAYDWYYTGLGKNLKSYCVCHKCMLKAVHGEIAAEEEKGPDKDYIIGYSRIVP